MTTQNTTVKDVTTMMFYDMSQQYHAGRIRSAAEQRRADDELGMMAARVARAWRRLLATGQRGGRSGGRRDALRARYAGQ
jgi:hypothetical protein